MFARGLSAAVGQEGRVMAVEADRAAGGHAAQNLSSMPQASVRRDKVDRVVASLRRSDEHADVIVLDPPRVGLASKLSATWPR
ncbi:RsmD family RNA methyltransferase [Ornithinimicrobium sp. INDO-MA30-4]|uniref:RsmD family RNA methyltransferase n=1 Tax=Ornithinimicrobium sp. INDO-MA30-4 TaxID=2908651 RepID=UPI001F1ECD86|nr:RsmD family RNA methyltransferase [Ornithinimicrobium sp. INDO-MA30-4]UJH71236.1 RsmD family RNA methyltransferase [Ornithinimicrobium sp. INDO-MA30-4]